MVATYSPHRDGGGTLHFPSPTHLHHVDPTSALAQLRRSLSRSPSKGPTFRLVASKSTSPSPSSPLSPSHISPQKRAGSASMLSNASVISPSPLATPFPPSARKNRSGARRLSPMRPSTRSQSAQRSPAKRALSECTDNGNSSPDSPTEAGPGLENRSTRSNSLEDKSDMEVDMNLPDTVMSDNLLAPRHAMVRRGEGSGCLAEFCAKSSPLKRSDGIMNLDQANRGSPSAKRRSLHAASFSPDFDIFDHEAALAGQGQSEMPDSGHGANSDVPSFLDHTSVFASLPKRTFSLRKTTLQQRYEKPSFGRPRPNSDAMHGVTTPGQTASKGRLRMSLDNLLPQPPRDSPFCLQGGLPSASVHPMGPQRRDGQVAGLPSLPQRHPLSRTITQSSSSSSLAEDSPTHVPLRQPEARRPSVDFSKSLPVGAGRPVGRESSSQGSTTQSFTTEASFATPDNYKLAKPLPAAFMSTGLISKRNKDMSAVQLELQTGVGNMPDTPCKRSTNLVAVAPVPIAADDASKPRAERRSIHSFGTPSTPFNLHTSRPSLGSLPKGVSIFGSSFTKGNLSRRNSFVSVEGDDNSQSPSGKFDSQSSAECEIPPTPTKQALGSSSVQHERGSVIEGSMPSPRAFHNYESRGPSGPQSPLPDHFCKLSPKETPGGSVDGDVDCVMEDSPSATLRFRSLNAISSFSNRSRFLGHSRSPTPLSRNALSLPFVRTRNMKTKPSPLSPASPLFDRIGQKSPHTPQESILPPDPSGLSISARGDGLVLQSLNEISNRTSVFPPATPTAPRESFMRLGKSRSSLAAGHPVPPAEVDPCLTSKFDKVEIIGTGEFSQVFRVAQKGDPKSHPEYFNMPIRRTSPRTLVPLQVWAVKKTRQAYIGPKDRQRKLREVEVLKALGTSDHTVQLFDSWENKDHLYIQTEYCEEGSLDLFLDQVGRKARLDDFRIWKIMLELSLVSLAIINQVSSTH